MSLENSARYAILVLDLIPSSFKKFRYILLRTQTHATSSFASLIFPISKEEEVGLFVTIEDVLVELLNLLCLGKLGNRALRKKGDLLSL